MDVNSLVQFSDYQAYADWLVINMPTSAAFSRMAYMTGKIVERITAWFVLVTVHLWSPRWATALCERVQNRHVAAYYQAILNRALTPAFAGRGARSQRGYRCVRYYCKYDLISEVAQV